MAQLQVPSLGCGQDENVVDRDEHGANVSCYLYEEGPIKSAAPPISSFCDDVQAVVVPE